MSTGSTPAEGVLAIAELKEFASFPPGTQRYIRRSLDVGLERTDACRLWSRDVVEQAGIRVQERIYEKLPEIRERVPEDLSLEWIEPFMAPLVAVSAFDLAQDRLPSFSAYRFLYERLLGATARPWLPGAFCAAAALPNIAPGRRLDLLQSISENAATAPGWSAREPTFFPAWIDKDEDTPPILN